jgi:hypothetical protein
MVNGMPQLLYPQGQDPVAIVQEAGWTTGTVWTQVQNLTPTGFDFWTSRPITSRYTDYTILFHQNTLKPALTFKNRASCI